jgi:hypothetical protein
MWHLADKLSVITKHFLLLLIMVSVLLLLLLLLGDQNPKPKPLLLQRANYEDAIQLDGSWEKAHFSYAVYLDSLYRDAKQREGKPAASKGMDRLSGRSRVRTPDDSPMDYLPQVMRKDSYTWVHSPLMVWATSKERSVNTT